MSQCFYHILQTFPYRLGASRQVYDQGPFSDTCCLSAEHSPFCHLHAAGPHSLWNPRYHPLANILSSFRSKISAGESCPSCSQYQIRHVFICNPCHLCSQKGSLIWKDFLIYHLISLPLQYLADNLSADVLSFSSEPAVTGGNNCCSSHIFLLSF